MLVMYPFFGISFSGFQIFVEWQLASFTNEPAKSARLAGFFRGTSSLGMCISFLLDSQGISFLNQAVIQLA